MARLWWSLAVALFLLCLIALVFVRPVQPVQGSDLRCVRHLLRHVKGAHKTILDRRIVAHLLEQVAHGVEFPLGAPRFLFAVFDTTVLGRDLLLLRGNHVVLDCVSHFTERRAYTKGRCNETDQDGEGAYQGRDICKAHDGGALTRSSSISARSLDRRSMVTVARSSVTVARAEFSSTCVTSFCKRLLMLLKMRNNSPATANCKPKYTIVSTNWSTFIPPPEAARAREWPPALADWKDCRYRHSCCSSTGRPACQRH